MISSISQTNSVGFKINTTRLILIITITLTTKTATPNLLPTSQVHARHCYSSIGHRLGSLSPTELQLLSLYPKFILTQLNNMLKLNIETNFCRDAYQLKWTPALKPTSTSTRILIHHLDNPLHSPQPTSNLTLNSLDLNNSSSTSYGST